MFELADQPIDPAFLAARCQDPAAGGYVTFEGWVRNHHEGRAVTGLDYEAYAPLATKEGGRVLIEALDRFDLVHAHCVHRVGHLPVGQLAVWIGVSAHHREPAFDACRYIIDEIKLRLPIWKCEHYTDGTREWVNCAHCAAHRHG